MQDYLFIFLGIQVGVCLTARIFILKKLAVHTPFWESTVRPLNKKRDQFQPFPNSTDCHTKDISMPHGLWPSQSNCKTVFHLMLFQILIIVQYMEKYFLFRWWYSIMLFLSIYNPEKVKLLYKYWVLLGYIYSQKIAESFLIITEQLDTQFHVNSAILFADLTSMQ